MYRKEGTDGNHTISVVKEVDNAWQIVKEIPFPKNLSWANFRIGLGGGFLTDKLMILHGVNKSQSVKFVESLDEAGTARIENFGGIRFKIKESYEYAFGLARFEYDKDENGNPLYETLRLVEVSQHPLLTHSQMREIYRNKYGEDHHKEFNENKKVIYTCDKGIISGNYVQLLVTFGDTKTYWLFLPKDYVLNFLGTPVSLEKKDQIMDSLHLRAA